MSGERRSYGDKLRDPRWQKRRLEILSRDDWTCQICFDKESTLNVHHRWYERGKEPWDSSDDALVTLCETCHQNESQSRADAEDKLLQVLRRHFFADDLGWIANAFFYMTLSHAPSVFAAALDSFLIERDNVDRICKSYIENLKEQQEADEEAVEILKQWRGGAP